MKDVYQYFIMDDFNYLNVRIKKGLWLTKETKQFWIFLPN